MRVYGLGFRVLGFRAYTNAERTPCTAGEAVDIRIEDLGPDRDGVTEFICAQHHAVIHYDKPNKKLTLHASGNDAESGTGIGNGNGSASSSVPSRVFLNGDPLVLGAVRELRTDDTVYIAGYVFRIQTHSDANAPTRDLLADKLIDFVEHASVAIKLNAYSWMENELGINVARRDWVNVNTVELAAAAERGDPKAQFSLVLMSVTEGVGSPADRNRWVDNALTNGDPTSIEWSSITLWYGLQGVSIILGVHDETSPGARRQALDNLQTAAECGSATAQYIFGMLKLWSGFKSSGMFTFEMETS